MVFLNPKRFNEMKKRAKKQRLKSRKFLDIQPFQPQIEIFEKIFPQFNNIDKNII